MIISDERLRELAEAPVEDYHDLALAVQHLAIALLEQRVVLPSQNGDPESLHPAEQKRLPGKPLGDKLTHPCSRCQADVVTFTSKRNGRPYQCDVQIGMYKNQRTVLTAANWFHKCPERPR